MANFKQSVEKVKKDAEKLAESGQSKDGVEVMDAEDELDQRQSEIDGDVVTTCGPDRGPQSSIHTNFSMLNLSVSIFMTFSRLLHLCHLLAGGTFFVLLC